MAVLRDSYINLIASQHRDKPKYVATIGVLLGDLDNIFSLGMYLDDNFDLDMADTDQENILGDILGIERKVKISWDEENAVLDNATYRNLLKAKIVKNTWRGSVEELQSIWRTVFPEVDLLMIDNQDMSIDVNVYGLDDEVTRKLIAAGHIIPRPAGVLLRYNFINKRVFGYEYDNERITGYSINADDGGEWA